MLNTSLAAEIEATAHVASHCEQDKIPLAMCEQAGKLGG